MSKVVALEEWRTDDPNKLREICKSLRARVAYAILAAGGEVKFPYLIVEDIQGCEELITRDFDGITIKITRPEGDTRE